MIKVQEQLFPFCIVWTILPCISWFLPWIGHAGICDSTGIIYDFLGYHINSREMAFGKVVKFVRLFPSSEEQYDNGVRVSNKKFAQQAHNLCCNNCHHHVAEALNCMKYQGKDNWTQVGVWWLCLRRSEYVSWGAVLKVYLPFLLILGLIVGLILGLK